MLAVERENDTPDTHRDPSTDLEQLGPDRVAASLRKAAAGQAGPAQLVEQQVGGLAG
jgi:hypothetical protein